jgi:putative intracellular protease/amidase
MAELCLLTKPKIMKQFIQANSKAAVIFICCALITFNNQATAQKKQSNKMEKKILFVVTSHAQKGNTGQPTGYYLSEVAHPWSVLTKAGYEIDFVSPQGGKAPVDGLNLNDPINKEFWENEAYRTKIENTKKPSEVNASDYVAIFYAGGHGTMWDFADNKELASLATQIYENGGIVSAVCHGPAGLVNIKLSNGRYLIDGKKINGFTNEEEIAVKLEKVVPFMLETKLIERGARFEKSGLWQPHVTVDQRVITGQNPASAHGVGEATLKELKKIKQPAAAN